MAKRPADQFFFGAIYFSRCFIIASYNETSVNIENANSSVGDSEK